MSFEEPMSRAKNASSHQFRINGKWLLSAPLRVLLARGCRSGQRV